MDLGDLPETIPLERKKSRGRPRKYPRLEDVLRYKESQEKKEETAHQNLGYKLFSFTSLQLVGNTKNPWVWLVAGVCILYVSYIQMYFTFRSTSKSASAVSESINEKAIQTDSNSEAIKRTSSEPPVVAPPSLIKTEDNKSHEDTMG